MDEKTALNEISQVMRKTCRSLPLNSLQQQLVQSFLEEQLTIARELITVAQALLEQAEVTRQYLDTAGGD